MTINLDDLLNTASLTVRSVPVCLNGDLTGALEDAADALATHKPPPGQVEDKRLGSRGSADPIRDGLQRVYDEAFAAVQEASVAFRVRGLNRESYIGLQNEHPPRTEGPDASLDRQMGWNGETFPDALLRACLVEPEISGDEQWARLLSVLTFAQQDDLQGAALAASRNRTDVPFSSAAFGKKPTSA